MSVLYIMYIMYKTAAGHFMAASHLTAGRGRSESLTPRAGRARSLVLRQLLHPFHLRYYPDKGGRGQGFRSFQDQADTVYVLVLLLPTHLLHHHMHFVHTLHKRAQGTESSLPEAYVPAHQHA